MLAPLYISGPTAGAGVPSSLYVDLFNSQTVAGAKTLNDVLTVNKAAESGIAETIAIFRVSDQAGSRLTVENTLASDGFLDVALRGRNASSNRVGLQLIAQGTADASSNVMVFNSVIGTSTTVAVRPLAGFQNNGVDMLTLAPLNAGAGACLVNPTGQAGDPTLTTRSAGTRFVLHNTITGATADYAIGRGSGTFWQSVPSANSTYSYEWWGGVSRVAILRADGILGVGAVDLGFPNSATGGSFATGSSQLQAIVASGEASILLSVRDGARNRRAKMFVDDTNGIWGLKYVYSSGGIAPFVVHNSGVDVLRIDGPGTMTTVGGRVVKTRTALTSPVSVGVTDYDVSSNLTVAGPVSVVLPAPATAGAGALFIVSDEKGDAAANNVTITATGGALINGSASNVINTAYGTRTLIVNAAATAYKVI